MQILFISLIALLEFFMPSCKSGNTAALPSEQALAQIQKMKQDSSQRAYILSKINGYQKMAQLDSFFNKKVNTQAFNGAILVSQFGQILYKNTAGYADYQNQEMINSATSFQLASVSKQFTAVAIMQLYEKHYLNFDDLVTKFYPDFPYPDVTIHLLLCHRSGLPNYLNFAGIYWKDKTQILTNQSLMQMMAVNKPKRNTAPNSVFSYCNTNYAILAAIVEKISGVSFAQYMQENVFKPLDMQNSWIYTPQNFNEHSNKAIGYSRFGFKRGGFDYTDGVTGDKGVYCSIDDMWKWDVAMYNNTLLSKETYDIAYTPRSFERAGIKNYGYGWRMFVYSPTVKAVYHNGWWHQFNNAYFRGLNDMTTVIVLGNTSNFSNYQIQPILDILSGRKSDSSMEIDNEDMEK